MVLTPPTSAALQSPAAMALVAWCRATVDDEQAVSSVMDGPLQENTYETRALWKARSVPKPPLLVLDAVAVRHCYIPGL